MAKMSGRDRRHQEIVSRPALPTAYASRRTRTGRRPGSFSVRRPRRSAAVVLETILALPIFVVMLMGLVEFGVLVENLQYVQAASRAGAMVASRTAAATLNGVALPADVLVAVNDELGRMQTGVVARQVRLETNVDNAGAVGATISRTDGVSATPNPYVAITAPAAPAGAYVRVTVFVDVPDVTPNVLAAFGLDFQNEVVQQTTTFPWAGP